MGLPAPGQVLKGFGATGGEAYKTYIAQKQSAAAQDFGGILDEVNAYTNDARAQQEIYGKNLKEGVNASFLGNMAFTAGYVNALNPEQREQIKGRYGGQIKQLWDNAQEAVKGFGDRPSTSPEEAQVYRQYLSNKDNLAALQGVMSGGGGAKEPAGVPMTTTAATGDEARQHFRTFATDTVSQLGNLHPSQWGDATKTKIAQYGAYGAAKAIDLATGTSTASAVSGAGSARSIAQQYARGDYVGLGTQAASYGLAATTGIPNSAWDFALESLEGRKEDEKKKIRQALGLYGEAERIDEKRQQRKEAREAFARGDQGHGAGGEDLATRLTRRPGFATETGGDSAGLTAQDGHNFGAAAAQGIREGLHGVNIGADYSATSAAVGDRRQPAPVGGDTPTEA